MREGGRERGRQGETERGRVKGRERQGEEERKIETGRERIQLN